MLNYIVNVITVFAFLHGILFVDSFARIGTSQHSNRISNILKDIIRSGSHGEGFKYIPIHQAKELENFPRIIPIAGVYPDLTPQDLLAPTPTLPFRKGSWTYDFSTPDDVQLGTVALPPSDIMTLSVDPVAVISTNVALGITNMPVNVEVVLVIDRGNKKFKAGDFYAFKNIQSPSKIIIQWCDKIPQNYEILGKCIICTIPWVEGMKKKSSGFIEDDEDETE